jgi:hypothetical protein
MMDASINVSVQVIKKEEKTFVQYTVQQLAGEPTHTIVALYGCTVIVWSHSFSESVVV